MINDTFEAIQNFRGLKGLSAKTKQRMSKRVGRKKGQQIITNNPRDYYRSDLLLRLAYGRMRDRFLVENILIDVRG